MILQDITEDLFDFWGEGWGGKAMIVTIGALIAGCIALVVLVVALIFNHVDSLHLHEGTIKNKRYSPAWTQQQCHTIGKSIVCVPITHPESWSITVEGVDDRGERNQRTVNVSENYWNQLQEGQYYKID